MRELSWQKVAATLCAVLVFVGAFGQTFDFKHFGSAEGLPQASVRSIAQDQLGRIWFGTRDGICRFDGVDKHVFTHVPEDPGSLPENQISKLFCAADGKLWVGCQNGAVAYFDPNNEHFVTVIPKDEKLKDRFVVGPIHSFFEDSLGVVWIGKETGIFRYDPVRKAFLAEEGDDSFYRGFGSQTIADVSEDEEGRVWVAAHHHIWVWHNNHWLERAYDSFIWEVVPHEGKTFVVPVEPIEGYLTIEEDSLVFKDWKEDCQGNIGGNKRMIFDSKGRRWLGTALGLDVKTENECIFLQNDPANPSTLQGNHINCLFEDREGTIWVGTNGFGVSYYNEHANQFGGVSALGRPGYRLSHAYINGIGRSANPNEVFVATYQGLDLFNLKTGKVQCNLLPKLETMNNNRVVKSVLLDDEGTLWVGGSGGFFRKEPGAKKAVRMMTWMPHFLLQDSLGYVWAMYGSHLHKFDGDQLVRDIQVREVFPDFPGAINFNCMEPALHAEGYWIGTDHGIYFVNADFSEKRLFSFWPEGQDGEHQPSIKCIILDSEGNCWVGTDGHGFGKLDLYSGRIHRFDSRDGLTNDVVYSMLEDDLGNLWMGTNQGLSRFSPTDTSFVNYVMRDGLQSNEFNTLASYKDESGRLFFGGTHGLSYFDPSQLGSREQHFDDVFLDRLEVNREALKPGELEVLPSSISTLKELCLDHDQNNFSLFFAASDFYSPESMRYRYRLDGFDKDWTEPSHNRMATYTNVPPGTYTFRVTNSFAQGAWNPHEAQIVIDIQAPWWNTWWFRLLAGVGVMVLLTALYKTRVSFLESQHRALEEGVKERTNIITEKNEEILAQATRLQDAYKALDKANSELLSLNDSLERKVSDRTQTLTKANMELDRFVYSVSHDIRAPLSSILGLVDLMNMEVDAKDEEMMNYIAKVKLSAERLDRFTTDILTYSKNSRLDIQRQEIDFEATIHSVLDDLSFIPGASKMKGVVNVEQLAPVYTDISRVEVILRNIISNAVRHRSAEKPKVKINVKASEREIELQIRDNGEGMEPEILQKIFQMFYRGSQNSGTSGLGLYIVKETVNKLRGTISVESTVGRGTCFTIVLPNEYHKADRARKRTTPKKDRVLR